jgi:trans-aconitate methyltransferase
MNGDSKPYDANFYLTLQRGSYRSACEIVPLVRKMLPVTSVCDVGCGVGTWLRAFEESGVADILGLDGDYVPKERLWIKQDRFRSVDLSKSFSIPRRFDLVVSLEVAEHLSENRSRQFVEDLTHLGSTILFSAAIPGQGGVTHVNEQWQTYWASKFDEFGYTLCDALRPAIWYNDKIDYWYRQNTFIYCDKDVLTANTVLAAASHTPALSLVHPNGMSFADILQGLKTSARRFFLRQLPLLGKRL